MRARILITRSPHQASELADRLRALGLEPVLIPIIEFAEPTSFAALDAALTRLAVRGPGRFHWLLFTSANAVQVFHQRLNPALGSWPSGPRSFRIAAIGPSTARSLEAIGLRPDLIPSQAVAESLAEALREHARQPDGSATRFLLIRAQSVGDTPPREYLPEILRAAGAEVTLAPAYRTIVPADSIPAIHALFQPENRLDAITFTSSSSVRNLLSLCEAADVALPAESLRISIGPITSQTLREAGYPPHAESCEATAVALAETVLEALKARNS